MLAGVGGKTVAEAQESMSYTEFLRWCAYRNKYGGLHSGMRLDRAVARVGALFANMLARKKVLDEVDLSPYDKANQSIDDLIDDALSHFERD